MKNTDILTPVRRFFNLLKVDKQEVFSIYVYALFNGIVMLSIPLGIQAIISFLTAGESSLFMVNARETGFISTQLKLIELMAKNQKAQLAVDFAIGQLYQKF